VDLYSEGIIGKWWKLGGGAWLKEAGHWVCALEGYIFFLALSCLILSLCFLATIR
jgi:hypothetical protein